MVALLGARSASAEQLLLPLVNLTDHDEEALCADDSPTSPLGDLVAIQEEDELADGNSSRCSPHTPGREAELGGNLVLHREP